MILSPTISIVIPLFKSRRFVRVIYTNIKRLENENLEIIISDRHCYDNAIDILKGLLKSDERVRFIQSDDKIGWVDHFNELLQIAQGTYFMWMPHDDSFPRGYVKSLVESLEGIAALPIVRSRKKFCQC